MKMLIAILAMVLMSACKTRHRDALEDSTRLPQVVVLRNQGAFESLDRSQVHDIVEYVAIGKGEKGLGVVLIPKKGSVRPPQRTQVFDNLSEALADYRTAKTMGEMEQFAIVNASAIRWVASPPSLSSGTNPLSLLLDLYKLKRDIDELFSIASRSPQPATEQTALAKLRSQIEDLSVKSREFDELVENEQLLLERLAAPGIGPAAKEDLKKQLSDLSVRKKGLRNDIQASGQVSFYDAWKIRVERFQDSWAALKVSLRTQYDNGELLANAEKPIRFLRDLSYELPYSLDAAELVRYSFKVAWGPNTFWHIVRGSERAIESVGMSENSGDFVARFIKILEQTPADSPRFPETQALLGEIADLDSRLGALKRQDLSRPMKPEELKKLENEVAEVEQSIAHMMTMIAHQDDFKVPSAIIGRQVLEELSAKEAVERILKKDGG